MPYAASSRNNKPVKIYYEDIGDSDLPVLVMQHGDGNESQNWKSLGYVELLQKHCRLILIDYLGYGGSEKSYDPNDYAMPLLAADTIAVLKHLKISTPVFFFGGSMGGRVGYELATTPEYARHFKAFIINGMGSSTLDIVVEFSKWAQSGGMPYVVEQMENFMAEPFPAEVKETFLRNDPKAYDAANRNPWPSITDRLPDIDKPVLLICGEKADELKDMKATTALIPNAKLEILPGLDHAQAYWYGPRVAPLIKTFIANT
jgi:pimeloyl-ACP methyl ester carboxylesterase